VRIVVANLHAGVTGWGYPTHALEKVLATKADIIVAPETWRSPEEDNLAAFADAGYHGSFAHLADAERVTTGAQKLTWQPLLAHLTGEHGLYFSEHRDLKPAQRRRRGLVEQGQWGLSLFGRLPLIKSQVVELERRPREKVRRSLIVATFDWDERPLHVIAVHGPHLSHGAHQTYQQVREVAHQLEGDTLLAGDFNAWRPPLRLFFPGWRSLGRAKTWPMHLAHSQIDHVLTRSHFTSRVTTLKTGSDHRALIIDLERQ
jgi:endonuclease/exonuclease/phosphatase family metal-dependent hydrolase